MNTGAFLGRAGFCAFAEAALPFDQILRQNAKTDKASSVAALALTAGAHELSEECCERMGLFGIEVEEMLITRHGKPS